MTVLEGSPPREQLLDFIDEGVRALHDAQLEPRFILVGPTSYDNLCEAIAERFGRTRGCFEQYQYLTIVVDPFRGDSVCVAPAPRDAADGIRGETA